ncbi:tyrosine--tRNA ligase [Acidipropionibacterium timonense]|uniref:tyrosine--tRNA ligase n=1 Tax=Acidipropionibacterium timonense TaxID=2161818 RepID=UPI001031A1FE|nr:tyrosine--tRNA ligase [Acidipropionibacterium timonense]
MSSILDELTWRGMIADSTDREALGAHLAQGPVTFYVGFDPTASSLHIGHLMQLMVVRAMQERGHHPLLLVGGATGLIGDPKMTGERKMNDREVVAGWVESLKAQVSKYVDLEGPAAARIVNNYDWTSRYSALDLLRDVGKYFSINRMLARDVVSRRLDSGISYTEFSYVLLQSLDYYELHKQYGCTLQTGAQDQWGNITAGAEFIRRRTGDVVHGLVTPLLTKADGTKYGKTESGTVWVDPELTSAYAFHQFFLNAEDEKVIDYLKVFSPRSHEEIDELARQTAEEPWKRAAQHALADDITDLVHGRAQREAARKAAQAVFGRAELGDLDAATLGSVATELGARRIEGPNLPTVAEALELAGVVDSKSAGRRAVNEGGAYLNNLKETDPDRQLTADDFLAGGVVLVRRGKKTVGALLR